MQSKMLNGYSKDTEYLHYLKDPSFFFYVVFFIAALLFFHPRSSLTPRSHLFVAFINQSIQS